MSRVPTTPRGRRSIAATCGGRRGGAFTLIEVMLALALIVLLMGAIMGFLWDVISRRSALERGGMDLQASTSVIDRMEADLTAGLAGDPGIGAGVVGTSTSLKLLTRGVWLPSEDGAGGSAAGAGDLQGSEYVFDASAPRLSARRISYAAGAGSSSLEVVSERVERVRFRYFDGKQWRSSFDTLSSKGLPVAVEVAVWFASLGSERAKVKTAPGATATETSEAGASGTDTAAGSGESDTSGAADSVAGWGPPDRLRVIIVPDGPQAAWGAGAAGGNPQ